MTVEIRVGDAIDQLRQMPDESVHCCVTSPPYWGLRDYGVTGQIGLEETPDEWCARLVEVFREVNRVLRKDGTCWVNVGDSYSAGGNGTGQSKRLTNPGSHMPPKSAPPGYKPKDLIGQPWMLAFALRADGWYLRDAIVWAKPNPMPSSAMDRCTNAYEHVFLLAKSKRYFFDAEVIREKAEYGFCPTVGDPKSGRSAASTTMWRSVSNSKESADRGSKSCRNGAGGSRNCRNVWTIATEPFAEAHFATFPTELARRCILAGCPVGGTVLDPFGGAGTTGLVADRLQRNAILIELNAEYAAMARRRIDNDRGDLLDLMQQPKPEQQVMDVEIGA